MWAVGRYDLGLPEAEFWRLTPRLFNELLKRRRLDCQRQEFGVAVVASMVANYLRDPKTATQPYQIADFMATPIKRVQRDNRPDWRAMLRKVEILNKLFGGRDTRKR